MKCFGCGLYCSGRSSFLVHVSQCEKVSEHTESSVADDSDADPTWSPNSSQNAGSDKSEDEDSEASGFESEAAMSPLTEEQKTVARDVEKLLDEDENHCQDFIYTQPLPGQSCGPKPSQTPVQSSISLSSAVGSEGVAYPNQNKAVVPMTEYVCFCGIPAVRLQVKFESVNKGRCFFTCKKPPEDRCHFFEWIDNVLDLDKTSMQSNSKPALSMEMNRNLELTTDNTVGKKKDKYKRYFCVFCKCLVDHFPRHLLHRHKEEKEVVMLASLKVGSNERKVLIAELRGKGSLIYNTDYELNKGNLIVARRMKGETTEKNRTPCIKYHNYFSKSCLWRHYRYCAGEKNAPRDLQQRSSSINFKITENVTLCDRMKTDIIPGMEKGEVFDYILKDEIILSHGNYLCNRHKMDKHLTNMIRTKLRQLAKLTLEIKRMNPVIKDLDDALSPLHYDTFVSAVQTIVGFDGTKFKSPSLVGELGRSMKLVANRRIIHYIKFNNDIRKQEIDKWLHVFNYDYYHNVGKSALISIQRQKHGKVQLVPLIEDVIMVNEHIDKEINRTQTSLREGFNNKCFDILNKCIMSQIQIFNRKRAGEIEMFTIQEFELRHNINKDSDIYKTLKTGEKLCANRYVRVESRGKLNLRPASFLLTLKQVELINFLLSFRNEAGIDVANHYVFARKKTFYKAGLSLTELAYASDAKNPDQITGTWLRKQIATTTQALSFTENELTNLASFLGHDIKTHRQFYRLPSDAIHLAKISKLLMAMDNGSVSKFYGKSLEEIELNLDLGVELNENNDEDKEPGTSCKEKFTNKDSEKEDFDTMDSILTDTIDEKKSVSTGRDLKKKQLKTKPSHCNKTPPSKKCLERMTWKTPERQVTRKLFKEYIYSKDNKLPTPMEVRQAIKSNDELRGRSVGQVKGWVFSEKRRVQKDK